MTKAIGDPKTLLDVRRQYYGKLSHLLAISHPDRATGLDPSKHWGKGIMRLYADSTRFVWYWPCPHCGAWSSPAPIARRVMTLEWPKDGTLDEIERGAHLLCPVNGCIIEDRDRRGMNIAAFNAPFGGWIGLARRSAKTVKSPASDQKRHRRVLDTRCHEQLPAQGHRRPGPRMGQGAAGIRGQRRRQPRSRKWWSSRSAFPTPEDGRRQCRSRDPGRACAAGRAAARGGAGRRPLPDGLVRRAAHLFDLMVGGGVSMAKAGWSTSATSRPRPPRTARPGTKLLEELIAQALSAGTDPARGMAIRGIGYDSAGAPGTTDQAYSVWRRLREKRLLRNFGRLDGRDLHSVVPTKGASALNAPMLSVVYPSSQRKDRKVVRAGIEPLAIFNPNVFKDDLAGSCRSPRPARAMCICRRPCAPRNRRTSCSSSWWRRSARTPASLGKAGWRPQRNDRPDGRHARDRQAARPDAHQVGRAAVRLGASWDKNSMVGPMTAPPAPSADTPPGWR
jgi:hypothetical protein